MKKVLSVCLAIFMVFAVFQGVVFAEDNTDVDDRYLWIGVPPQDITATNFLLDLFLNYVNSDNEGIEPITYLDDAGLSDYDWIKEMLFGLFEGKDSRNWLIIGDIDYDDKITVEDARWALRIAVGLTEHESDSVRFMAADVDKNGEVSTADARAILRVAIGLDQF